MLALLMDVDVEYKMNVMMTKDDVNKLYDTILSIPGMNEIVKIDLKISRKNVLMLTQVIERGLGRKADNEGTVLGALPDENLRELKAISDDCLQKAGLSELNEKLSIFSVVK